MINQIINKTKVPIKIWASNLEYEALEQAILIADNLPLHDHLALMADAHAGAGMPIGGVMGLKGGISPMAVGADIGCGMGAIRTSLTEIPLGIQKMIFAKIREAIPVGFNHRNKPMDWIKANYQDGFKDAPLYSPIIKKEIQASKVQLGTLGGGNHFIEFQIGSDGNIWVMLHSGSRNLGKKVADHYHALALEKGIVTIKALPFFELSSDAGKEYQEVMNFSLAFAQANRDCMMNIIVKILKDFYPEIEVLDRVNIHHNYAVEEVHYGEKVVVHRKGATLATENTVGIIPGSQGSFSYIVHGKGNAESFNSCSHGAGRLMSRSKAKKTLDPKTCTDRMLAKGILVDFSRGNLDEAEEAYKDIQVVMANQSDLVDIVVELKPYQIAAIKG